VSGGGPHGKAAGHDGRPVSGPGPRGWPRPTGGALLAAVWLGLVVTFGLLTDHFFSTATLLTVAGRLPALAVVAAGMTPVIIAGGIDLSSAWRWSIGAGRWRRRRRSRWRSAARPG